jgi:hypothetical protein
VIENALEKDAGARFHTAAELGRALVASSGFTPRWSSLLSSTDGAAGPGDREGEEPARAIRLVRKKTRPEEASARGAPDVGSGLDHNAPPTAAVPSARARSDQDKAVGVPWRRRHFVRAPYVTPVLVTSPSGSEIDARSEEISEEGMLVVAPLSLPLSAPLKLRFASPATGEMMIVAASVRWTREGRAGRNALGLEFINAPPGLRAAVARYLATMPVAHG